MDSRGIRIFDIDDLGQGNRWRRRRAITTPGAPNKAKLPLLATSRSASVGGQGVEIRDTIYEIRGNHVDIAPNKANSPGDHIADKANSFLYKELWNTQRPPPIAVQEEDLLRLTDIG